jgi:hypothetical protein
MAKPKYIETPEKLWGHFEAYREWAKANPYKVTDWVGAKAIEVVRHKERPLTWVGFEAYLSERRIINDLGDYTKNDDGRYKEYAPIITCIRKIINADQLEGAGANVYQQNIVARLLGLVDKQDNKSEVTLKGVEITVRKTGLPQINSEKDIPDV